MTSQVSAEEREIDIYAIRRLLGVGEMLRNVLSDEEIEDLAHVLDESVQSNYEDQQIGNASVS
jgi:hypothetical protein